MATVYPKIAGTPDGSVTILAQSNVTRTITGTIGATSMASYTLPANTMGANDILRITTLWGQPVSQTGNISTIIKIGSAELLNNIFGAADAQQTINFFRANNSLTAQKSFGGTFADSYKETGTANNTYSEDTTTDLLIDFIGASPTASEVLTLESYTIELLRAL